MVYRDCVSPPIKIVMVQKFEEYLCAINKVSGIDIAAKNFPDKAWLVLAVASLSDGSDEIFHPEYLPNKGVPQAIEDRNDAPQFSHVPKHLLAKGKGR